MSQLERTFAIIKPDAVAAGHVGEILTLIEQAGFRILALRQARLSPREAESFYAVHRQRPFFSSLVRFMTEGPCVLMVLERENAIAVWRQLMGPTDPAAAPEGTIRKRFGTNIERNAVHGSDGAHTAAFEVPFFFSTAELL
jgi:nucleoside-diphosphate kinase